MGIIAYFEFFNAIVSFLILLMLIYILWMMVYKQDIIKSLMFLKSDKLKSPTVLIACGVILFTLREAYKAADLIGVEVSEVLTELLEFGSVILFFIGSFLVFRLFRKRKP